MDDGVWMLGLAATIWAALLIAQRGGNKTNKGARVIIRVLDNATPDPASAAVAVLDVEIVPIAATLLRVAVTYGGLTLRCTIPAESASDLRDALTAALDDAHKL